MGNLKLFNSSASCSLSSWESPAAEYTELSVSLDSILINNPNSTFLAYASGDSMNGDGIFDGDLLCIDRKPQAMTGSIVVVYLNGSLLCKKLDVERRLLLSSNPEHKPIKIEEGDDFSIEGTVIRSVRLFTPLPDFI
ncbi:S24 family peptidase [Vibrio chagasii]|uniref:S24 family peptidase n=1 Tax=Vibrio chagasii TaxID=170679 RepID=A0A7V7NWY8_9VIBR|nr:S24 family peptidase [Vibrio chagasii]KAB0482435.1 S24 family peptidase [Vibrio chagasii]